MSLLECPIPAQHRYTLESSLEQLIPQCRLHSCPFVDSIHDTDYMPGGCILIVAALLEHKKRTQANQSV